MSSESARYNIEDFEWSDQAIPIREFADRFADLTPFMVVTTYPGCGTSKEMHWLFEILKEKHVIVQDAEGRYFCIPIKYKRLVKSKKEKHGELGEPMSVEDALHKQGARFIVFEGPEGPPFTEDEEYVSLKHIKAEELLTVKGTHEESHLVLHSFQKGGSLPKNFIMVSDFQSMAVAVAINRQKDQRTNQFYADMLQCYDAANSFPHDYESRLATSDIRRLKGLPEKKSHWHTKLKPAWNKLKGMTSSHQKELSPVLEVLEKLKTIYPTGVVDDRTEPLYDMPESGTTEHRGSEERRPLSPPRPAYVNGMLRDAMDKPKPTVPARKTSLANDEPPTLAPRSTSAHQRPMSDNGAQSQQHCAPAVSLRPQTNGGEQKHVTVTRFSKLQDVPRDIKGLNVGEIGDCLMLLNMTQYQQAFQNAQIDGAYLSTMTVEVLKEEFNMSGYQTHRLWQFASQGWRPKTE